jgi:Lipopolysaccharide-assembly
VKRFPHLTPVCGIDNRRAAVAAGLLLAASGCIYGFHGGGLPADVKTIAILPFDNETPEPGLEEQLLTAMRKSLGSRLGVGETSEGKADAIVSGSITRYDVDIPIGYSASTGGAPVTGTRRKLEMSVDVEIVDQKSGKTLFERKGLVADGEYAERAESDGLHQAVDKLVDDMVEGAQSQW